MLSCIIGLVLLVSAPVLCWFQYDRPAIWLGVLIIGEFTAWHGVFSILSKFSW